MNAASKLFLVALAIAGWLAAQPISIAQNASRLDTPNLLQTDPSNNFPGKGREYCGPVATANALVWLSKHGYPSLCRDQTGKPLDEIEVARTLGSSAYMNTSTESGTFVGKMVAGVRKYCSEHGCVVARSQYEGWRLTRTKLITGYRTPRLGWIKDNLNSSKTGCLLEIGWYSYDPDTDTYVRRSGHWVTLIGFGQNKDGTPNPNALLINNPNNSSGKSRDSACLMVERISHGTLWDKGENESFNARGFYKITSGIGPARNPSKYPNKFAIIDGASVFELQ